MFAGTIEYGLFPYLQEIIRRTSPFRHPFFRHLAALPERPERLTDILARLYLCNQEARKATANMADNLPFPNTFSHVAEVAPLSEAASSAVPDTKLCWQIQVDGIHAKAFGHVSKSAFTLISPASSLPDHDAFTGIVQTLYPLSPGPWIVVESLAQDWRLAMEEGLSRRLRSVSRENYGDFEGAFPSLGWGSNRLLEYAAILLERRPDMIAPTLHGAQRMATALDTLWGECDAFLSQHTAFAPLESLPEPLLSARQWY